MDNYLPPNILIIALNHYARQTGLLEQDLIRMPVELLVILGAEASILGFVAAMTLHAKRMDVLSGRSFERPIVPHGRNGHPPRSPHRKVRNLVGLTAGWAISSRSFHRICHGAPIAQMLRRILQIGVQTRVRFGTRARRADTPAPRACDRPALLSGTGRNTDAQGKGAGPENMQSSAAAILHELSAP
ncbi:hypothetical protein [Bradyrhizobium sp. USDA 372]